jgi:hypothetical protein
MINFKKSSVTPCETLFPGASRASRPETSFRALPECGSQQLQLHLYDPSCLMKSARNNDVFSGFLSVWARDIGSERSDQSFFSLLLEIESRLRAEARSDSLLQPGPRKSPKGKNQKRPVVERLSRYIE